MMIMCNGTKFNNNSNNNINEVKSEERNEMEWSEKKMNTNNCTNK